MNSTAPLAQQREAVRARRPRPRRRPSGRSRPAADDPSWFRHRARKTGCRPRQTVVRPASPPANARHRPRSRRCPRVPRPVRQRTRRPVAVPNCPLVPAPREHAPVRRQCQRVCAPRRDHRDTAQAGHTHGPRATLARTVAEPPRRICAPRIDLTAPGHRDGVRGAAPTPTQCHSRPAQRRHHRSVNAPSPICPRAPAPHANTRPSGVAMTLCARPRRNAAAYRHAAGTD